MKKIMIFLIACILLCGNTTYASEDNSHYILKEGNWSSYRWFSEGLCAVLDRETQRWGFVDTKGNWVIAPQYKDAKAFNDGLCNVTTADNAKVLINRNGEVVHPVYSDSEQYVKLLNGCGYVTAWIYDFGFLVDADYKDIAKAKPLNDHTYSFFRTQDEKIYNSKGVDITNKLNIENFYDCDANNKYLVYCNDEKVFVHNVDGNLISSFSHNNSKGAGTITLFSEAIKIREDENLYSIDGKVVLSTQDEINEYYSKYYVISKRNGTSALYKKDGTQIIDFGKWDAIVPSSIAEQMLVSINNKYGIADFNNNLIVPLAGSHGEVINNGKTAIIDTDYQNQRTLYDFCSMNYKMITDSNAFGTIPSSSCRIIAQLVGDGYNWSILDERLNTIKTVSSPISVNGGSEGIYLFNGADGFYEPDEYVIFNDGGGIKVKLDRTPLAFDVQPVIQNGRTLVPMRVIFEALGAEVTWDGATKTIIAKNKDVIIQMQIDNHTLTKNGQSSQMDVCPQLIDGRTMVPVRAVSDSFDVIVDWNGYTRTVSLFTN